MTNPILYLDYDGVLHRLGEPALNDNFRLLDNPNLFCWAPILATLLIPYPTVQIIVSSDWRRLFSDDQLAQLLGPALGERVIGAIEFSQPDRALEILNDAHHRKLTRWIALDDHETVVAARRAGDTRYVVCAPQTGISDPRVQHVLVRKLSEFK